MKIDGSFNFWRGLIEPGLVGLCLSLGIYGFSSDGSLARASLLVLGGAGGGAVVRKIAINGKEKAVAQATQTERQRLEAEYRDRRDALKDKELELEAQTRDLERDIEQLDRQRDELEQTARIATAARERELETEYQQRFNELDGDYQRRCAELDANRQELERQQTEMAIAAEKLASERERLQLELDRERNNIERSAQEVFNEKILELQQQRSEIEQQANQRIAEAVEPLYEDNERLKSILSQQNATLAILGQPRGQRPIDHTCRAILQLLLDNEIFARCAEEQPSDTITHQNFYFRLAKLADLDKIKKLKSQLEYLFDSTGSISVKQLGGVVRIEFAKGVTSNSLSRRVTGEVEQTFYNLEDIEQEASGIIVAGNTGAAKSSMAIHCAGLLTRNQPMQAVALDPHATKNHWHEFGFPVVNDPDEILKAIRAILERLNHRRKTGEDSPELLIIFDEIGALKADFRDDKEAIKDIESFLLKVGSEGRKFGITLIAINQSKNVEALGIDGQYRNNYLLLLLNAAIEVEAKNAGWGYDDLRWIYYQSHPYTAMVSGCVSPRLTNHATHEHHKQFQKKGAKPRYTVLPRLEHPTLLNRERIRFYSQHPISSQLSSQPPISSKLPNRNSELQKLNFSTTGETDPSLCSKGSDVIAPSSQLLIDDEVRHQYDGAATAQRGETLHPLLDIGSARIEAIVKTDARWSELGVSELWRQIQPLAEKGQNAKAVKSVLKASKGERYQRGKELVGLLKEKYLSE